MSSKKYASPLQLDLKPSRILLFVLLTLHLLAFGVIFALPISIIFKILLCISVLVTLVYFLYSQVLRISANAIIRIIWDASDEWLLVTRSGKKLPAKLQGDSFSHPKMAVLNFRIPGRLFQKSVVLLNDNVDQNIFRRLRVRLKISNHSQNEEF